MNNFTKPSNSFLDDPFRSYHTTAGFVLFLIFIATCMYLIVRKYVELFRGRKSSDYFLASESARSECYSSGSTKELSRRIICTKSRSPLGKSPRHKEIGYKPEQANSPELSPCHIRTTTLGRGITRKKVDLGAVQASTLARRRRAS